MAIKEAIDTFMQNVSVSLSNVYVSLTQAIPEKYQVLLHLFFYSIFIAFYLWFIWRFHSFLAKRDLIKMDLERKYWFGHPFLNKTSAVFMFILEHIVLLPFVVVLWFMALSLFFVMLAPVLSIETIVFVSATLIVTARMISYYSEDLSKDLVRIVSLTLLAIFLISSDTFSFSAIIERIKDIPLLLETLSIYFVFIVILELILKTFFSFTKLISYSSVEENEEDTTTVKELVEKKKEENKPPVIVKKEEVFDYTPSAKVNKDNKYFVVPKKSRKK